MTFSLDDHWVWDFWLADDGEQLPPLLPARAEVARRPAPAAPQRADRPRDLGRPRDVDRPRPVVLGRASPATSTRRPPGPGSVVPGADGLWRMFYTGSRFLVADAPREHRDDRRRRRRATCTRWAQGTRRRQLRPTPGGTRRSATAAGPRRRGATRGCSRDSAGTAGTCW